MKKYTTADALKTHEVRQSNRKNWDSTNDEIAYYVLPSQTGFITDFVPGEKERWSYRYDSTAGYANKKLANTLHMSMVSPSQPWFDVRLKNVDLGKQDVVKEWLEDTTKKMYLGFAESNFSAQINTLFQCFCAFGTASIETNFEVKANNPFTLIFKNIDLSICTFDYNAAYQIDTKVEQFMFTPRQAGELFDREFGDGQYVEGEKTIKILKVTRPNPDFVPDSIIPKERAYLIEWCYAKKKFKTETAYEQPFQVVRFSQVKQDSIYGEGPALLALSPSITNSPISPVRATCVPPQSSNE
jgi:hypothetical protein